MLANVSVVVAGVHGSVTDPLASATDPFSIVTDPYGSVKVGFLALFLSFKM